MIAHRGASAYRPENTLSAYALAVEQRADMIEIDLHRTRDGALAVAHDAELERIGGRGEIGDCSVEEIRALDAGDGERVPLLGEVLDAFGQTLPFNLELKRARGGDYPGLCAEVVRAVEERDSLARHLFSSFYDSTLAELRGLAPAARIAVLVSPRAPDRIFERAAAVEAEAINPYFSLATAELIREAHERGLAVYVFTVDERDMMQKLIDDGVDGLFTNRPDRMRALLEGSEPPHPPEAVA